MQCLKLTCINYNMKSNLESKFNILNVVSCWVLLNNELRLNCSFHADNRLNSCLLSRDWMLFVHCTMLNDEIRLLPSCAVHTYAYTHTFLFTWTKKTEVKSISQGKTLIQFGNFHIKHQIIPLRIHSFISHNFVWFFYDFINNVRHSIWIGIHKIDFLQLSIAWYSTFI